ncbi:MAG: hypothetical protein JRH11_16725 [Deltaproteobacteria bacterium]|nr:hypothetical protein [Deltaproteobacteria bacterium]
MRPTSIFLVAVLFSWGCSTDDPGPSDATTDSGTASDSSVPDDATAGDSSLPDDATATDSMVAIDSSTPPSDAGTDTSTAVDSSTPPSDTGTDTGTAVDSSTCTPESTAAFCSRMSATCGSISGTDNCGAARTESCGVCAGALTCAGGSAGANACGCTAPPSLTGLTVSCAGGSPRVSFTGTTTIYAYTYASGTGAPRACNLSPATLVGAPGFNRLTLLGGPSAGQCGLFRLCAYEMMCDTDYSPGRLISMCVDSAGSVTCTVG